MTPLQRRRKAAALARSLRQLADKVDQAVDDNEMDINVLLALHRTAPLMHQVREQTADLKGAYAAAAKRTMTHIDIADALGVSKPYVQQMVYRGERS